MIVNLKSLKNDLNLVLQLQNEFVFNSGQRRLHHKVFGLLEGDVLVDYLQSAKKINSPNYRKLLEQRNEKNRESRPGLQKKKIFFLSKQYTSQKYNVKI